MQTDTPPDASGRGAPCGVMMQRSPLQLPSFSQRWRLNSQWGPVRPPGVIRQGDVVTRAFARIGWTWGGTWQDPDYQHFSAP